MKQHLRGVRATRVGGRLSAVRFDVARSTVSIRLDVEGRAAVRCDGEMHVVLPRRSPWSSSEAGGHATATAQYKSTVTAARVEGVLTGLRIDVGASVVVRVLFDKNGGAVLRHKTDVVVISVPESPKLSILQAGDSRYAAVVLRSGLPDLKSSDLEGSVVILDGHGDFMMDGDVIVVAGERLRFDKGQKTYGAGDEITIGGKRAVIHLTQDDP